MRYRIVIDAVAGEPLEWRFDVDAADWMSARHLASEMTGVSPWSSRMNATRLRKKKALAVGEVPEKVGDR